MKPKNTEHKTFMQSEAMGQKENMAASFIHVFNWP